MASNQIRIAGLNLTPLSADPSGPVEGDLQYADGTARTAGLWQYKGGAWVQFNSGPAGALSIVTKTADYLATTSDDIILCNATSSITINLPTAVGNSGKELLVKKLNSDISQLVTIDPNSTELIDGAATYVLYTLNETLKFVSDGANWIVLEHKTETPLTSAGTITIGATTTPPTKGTTAFDNVSWTREGQYAICYYQFKKTVTGGAAIGSGEYLFSLPTNITLDTTLVSVFTGTSLLTNSALMGNFILTVSAGASAAATIVPYSSTQFRLLSIADGFVDSNTFDMNNASTGYIGWVKIPVSGWKP